MTFLFLYIFESASLTFLSSVLCLFWSHDSQTQLAVHLVYVLVCLSRSPALLVFQTLFLPFWVSATRDRVPETMEKKLDSKSDFGNICWYRKKVLQCLTPYIMHFIVICSDLFAHIFSGEFPV